MAAEKLFANEGYHGVSLRQITREAKTNVAALNYHHYDKPTLYRKILSRRLNQINQRRLELLDLAQSKAGDDPVPLSEIFAALAAPLLIPAEPDSREGMRLVSRILLESPALTGESLPSEFQPAMLRFGQAIRRHAPALPPADFLWQFSFVLGALHHAVLTLPDMPLHTRGLCPAHDGQGALRNFVLFATHAFKC